MIITKTEVWHVNHFIHDEWKKEKNMIYSKMISYSHKDNIKFRNYMWKIIYENTKKPPSFEWTLFNFFYSNKNNHAYLILLQTINATFSIRGWKRNKASLSWLTID